MALTRDEFLNSMYPTEFLETLPELDKKVELSFLKKDGFMRMLKNNGRFSGGHKGWVGTWDYSETEAGEIKTWGHNTQLEATDEDDLARLEMPWTLYYDALHFSEIDALLNSGKEAIRDSLMRKRKRRRISYNQQLSNKVWNGDGSAIAGSRFRHLQGIRTFMKSTGTSGLSYPAGQNGASLDNTAGHKPVIVDGDTGTGSAFLSDAVERILLAVNTATRTVEGGECSPTHGFISRTSKHTLSRHLVEESTMYVDIRATKTSDTFKYGFNGGFNIGGVDIEMDEHLNDKELFMFSPETFDLESAYDTIVKFEPRSVGENVGEDKVEAFKSILRLKCRRLGCQALVHWA
jgi:hypothetical protein